MLKRFMWIGAFCFCIAVVAEVFLETRTKPGPSEHLLALEVVPHDSGDIRTLLPQPIIKMRGQRVDRSEPLRISSDETLIVDLLDSVDLFQLKELQIEQATAQVEQARSIIEEQNTSLRAAQAQTMEVTREIEALKATAAITPEATPRIDQINRDLLNINRGIGNSIRILP